VKSIEYNFSPSFIKKNLLVDMSWCLKLNPENILKALENNTLLKYLNISYCSLSSLDTTLAPRYYLSKIKKDTEADSLMPSENFKDSQSKLIETNNLSKPIAVRFHVKQPFF
jgi:hypothetical protein